jgi:uncharacterized membrane protein
MSIVNKAVGIGVGLLVAAAIVPIALLSIADTNTATWGATGTVFSILLPILAVVSIALYFLPRGK